MSGLSFQTAILNPIVEIHSLMPDSILFGSLLLYLLTQNFAFGVFAVFIFENVYDSPSNKKNGLKRS